MKERTGYKVRVLPSSTSQTVVTGIKRTRWSNRVKNFTLKALAITAVVAGFGTVVTGTIQPAQANIITDWLCINESDAGSWKAGANLYYPLGGQPGFAVLPKSTSPASHATVLGVRAKSWGDAERNEVAQLVVPNTESLTALEKYGPSFPIFDVWKPVYEDEEFEFKGVDLNVSPGDTYNDGSGKLRTGTPDTLEPQSSELTSVDALSCLNFDGYLKAGVANITATPAKLFIQVATELYGLAMGSSIADEDSPLKPLGDAIDELVAGKGGLRDVLFLPFLIPLILIGAIWVAYVGIVKRGFSMAIQSVVWMIAAIAAGSIFLAQPTLITGWVDSVVTEVQDTLNSAVLQQTGSEQMCDVDDPDRGNEVKRETKCAIWYSTIYNPWVKGQFGASGQSQVLTEDVGGRNVLASTTIEYGSKRAVKPADWAQFMVDRQATGRSFELSEVAYAQLSGKADFGINDRWGDCTDCISASVMMNFGAIAGGLVLIVYGFILFIYQLMMVSLGAASPFFFLFGIVPNWGRRILMRWFELIASLGVKRVVTGFMLSLYLMFYGLITNEALPLLVQLIMTAALALFALVARSKFATLFSSGINFGGNKSIGLPGAAAGASLAGGLGALVGAGVGALTSGGTGAAVGARLGGAAGRKLGSVGGEDLQGSANPTLSGGSAPVADVRTPQHRNGVADLMEKGVKTAEVVDKLRNGKGGKSSLSEPVKTEGVTEPPQQQGVAPQGGEGGSVQPQGPVTRDVAPPGGSPGRPASEESPVTRDVAPRSQGDTNTTPPPVSRNEMPGGGGAEQGNTPSAGPVVGVAPPRPRQTPTAPVAPTSSPTRPAQPARSTPPSPPAGGGGDQGGRKLPARPQREPKGKEPRLEGATLPDATPLNGSGSTNRDAPPVQEVRPPKR